MARKVIRTDDSYFIEFETAGNGSYFMVPRDGTDVKGPYADEGSAMRAAVAFLEAKLGRAGADLEETMREDEEATRRAIAEAVERERKEKEQPAVATTDRRVVDDDYEDDEDRHLFRQNLLAPRYEPAPNRAAEGEDAPEPKRPVDVRKVRAIRPRIQE